MKKMKYLIVIGLCVLATLIVYLKYFDNSNEITDFNQANKSEKEALDLFYEMNSESISKGKIFDLKFVYFDKYDLRNSILEIVKKTDANIGDIEIETLKKNEEPIIFMNYGKYNNEKSYMFWGKGRKYIKFILGSQFLKDYPKRETFITNSKKYENFTEIKVIIEYKNSKETHIVKFNESDVFKNLELLKDKLDVNNEYENQLLSYYYGLLFDQDFSKWYSEMDIVLNSENIMDLDYDRIFHIPCDIEEHNLQTLYKLNDDEFAMYKAVAMKAIEKNLFYERSSHVKKLVSFE